MSRQLDHAYATLVAEPMPGPQPTIRGRNKVNSSFRMEIVNTMQVPVFWRNALGIIVNEPPAFCDNNTPECLYITIEYEFDRQTQIDIRELLSEIAGSVNHAEAKGIVKSLEALNKTPSAVQRKFSYTLGVTREKLEQLGGVVYLNDVDLVVGFEAYRETALHPFSPPGQRQRLSMSLETVAGFNQQYLLVDNSGVYGNRWLNTGVTVVELNAIPDARLRDGVYVTTRTGPEKQPTTIHLSLIHI